MKIVRKSLLGIFSILVGIFMLSTVIFSSNQSSREKSTTPKSLEALFVEEISLIEKQVSKLERNQLDFYNTESLLLKEERAKTNAIENDISDEKVPLVKDLWVKGYRKEPVGLCPEAKRILFLVTVISAPGNRIARDAIRDSWGRIIREKMAKAEILFVLGTPEDDSTLKAIVEEAEIKGDVIISNYLDSYRNLTLKTLTAFEWQQNSCQQAKFLVKVDDDVFLQVARLAHFLRGVRSQNSNALASNSKEVIYGNVASGWEPVRNRESKYYISPAAYSEDKYPAFVTGPSYAVSTGGIPDLLERALDHPYIFLEDVFLTGILAEAAGIPRRLVMEFRNNAMEIPPQFLGCTLLRTVSIHRIKPEEHKVLLQMARNPKCGGNEKSLKSSNNEDEGHDRPLNTEEARKRKEEIRKKFSEEFKAKRIPPPKEIPKFKPWTDQLAEGLPKELAEQLPKELAEGLPKEAVPIRTPGDDDTALIL